MLSQLPGALFRPTAARSQRYSCLSFPTNTPEQASIKTVVRGEKPGTAKIRMNGYKNASLFLVEIKMPDGSWCIVDAFDAIFSVIEIGTEPKVTIRVWGKNGTERSPVPSEEITF